MLSNEVTVIPLGTVSTYCTEDKCCPGYLVKYKDNNILLDCGNGISKHLNLPDDLNNLSIIISHLHSDHYGELLSLAQTSYVFHKLGLLDKRIKVYLPYGDNIIDLDYLLSLEKESYFEYILYDGNTKLLFEDMMVCFARNPHPLITYSTKLDNGRVKVVYSSDTGFDNNSLMEFAKNATLLICESTFLEGQKGKEDNHLTAYEAGVIAKEANVDKLLLTHFWPSIDKEEYVKEARRVFDSTLSAKEGIKLVLK